MKSKLNVLLLCLVAMLSFSCSDDDDSPNVGKIIDNVVPQYLRVQIEQYMPIYDGENPPLITGSYHMSPVQLLHSSDGQTPPGKLKDLDFGFRHQKNNRLDYVMASVSINGGGHEERGEGMYITGEGNNFTAFIATQGKSAGVTFTSGVIISGTYDATKKGIHNLRYATVMIDKLNDPKDKLMKIGVFRVFKDTDGWSDYFDWLG